MYSRGTTIIGEFHAGTAVLVGPISDLLCASLCISLALNTRMATRVCCLWVALGRITKSTVRDSLCGFHGMTAFKADANAGFSPIVKRAKYLSPLSVSDLVLFRDEVINMISREDILKLYLFILLRVLCKATTM